MVHKIRPGHFLIKGFWRRGRSSIYSIYGHPIRGEPGIGRFPTCSATRRFQLGAV